MAKMKSLVDFRKKVTEIHESISTSYHESSHAIYGLLNGFKVFSVTIFNNKDTNRIEGYTQYLSPNICDLKDPAVVNKTINSEICIKYAGLIAEKTLFKKMSGSYYFPAFLKDGSSDDTISAANIIKQYNVAAPGRPRYVLKKKLIKQTSKEIEDYWDDITLLSHHLFKRKKINFNDLTSILCRYSNKKKYWKKLLKNIDDVYNNTDFFDEVVYKSILSL